MDIEYKLIVHCQHNAPSTKLLLRHKVSSHSGWLPQLGGLVTIDGKEHWITGMNTVYDDDLELPIPDERFNEHTEPERIEYRVKRIGDVEISCGGSCERCK